ncbi:MAG: type II 3-dehydroquinate dehydratase [Bordetella sp.]|nr:MAG: type II 3-dehydroquinate dehydratase [Bordetella sp.]
MKRIFVMHGPNLNLLGKREPHIYGNATLDQINLNLRKIADDANARVSIVQSNHEGILIDAIQDENQKGIDFMIINAGAYTHTSIALRDTLSAISIPFIEVHLSNLSKRESFRNHSYLSDIAVGLIMGLGVDGYEMALRYALKN